MRIAFEVFVEIFQRLRCERRSAFAFFRRFRADKIGQRLYAVAVSLLRLPHPFLQHGFDLLRGFGRDVQLLKSAVGRSKNGGDFVYA